MPFWYTVLFFTYPQRISDHFSAYVFLLCISTTNEQLVLQILNNASDVIFIYYHKLLRAKRHTILFSDMPVFVMFFHKCACYIIIYFFIVVTVTITITIILLLRTIKANPTNQPQIWCVAVVNDTFRDASSKFDFWSILALLGRILTFFYFNAIFNTFT